MINIERELTAPVSLTNVDMVAYLNELANHHADPDNCAKPTRPPSYRTSDLLEAFDRCFFAKCYLTEEKFANSWGMDVEHFIGQKEDPTLTHEWTNLYPASHRANMMKPRNTPLGGYLDPCNTYDDVETEIFCTRRTNRF